MYNKKLMVTSIAVLLSLTLSLIFPMGVLADDNPPPTPETPQVVTPPEEVPTQEAAPTEIVVPTDVPVSDMPMDVATLEPTTVDAGSTESSGPLLSQLPENTEVVVTNADGEVVPLGSQEAADIIAVQDPVWCPNTQATPTPGLNGCTISYTSLAALIAATAGNVNRANGTIWIQSGTDTSASAVTIDGNNFNNWRNNSLTIMGGWNGVSGSSTINGVSTFNVPLNLLNWRNTITVNNVTVSGTTGTGITVTTRQDNITLNQVTANNNTGDGASLGFTNNGGGSITVNNSSFSNNGGWGLNTNANANARPLTLNNDTFSGNTSGAYNHPLAGLTTSCTAPKYWVAGTGCVTDVTVPTISAAISAGTLGSNGWYRTNVTVHFTCADAGSGIATCPADQVLNTEGASVSSTAQTATDNAGLVSLPSNVITVKIDKTAPTIVAAATTSPTAAGWYNANVTVHFTCTDGASGIVSCPADQLFTTAGTFTSTAQTTTDNAGNVSAASNTVTVRIDKTIPTISAAISAGTLGLNGWYRTNVTVHFTCADTGGSGIATCPADQVLNTEGASVSSTAQTAVDNAGNVSLPSNVITVKIDKTAPTIVAAATTSPTAAGWYNANVTVHFTCTDGASGIVSCPADQLFTTAGTFTSTAQTTTDNAGNVSAASNTVTVRIDKTIPTISAAISAGTLGLNGWYRTNVTVHFTCADTGGSGIATCPADQVLNTEGASVSSTAQTAVDNAGNVSLPSNVITVKIDKTAPTIVAAATTSPTAAGWYNANVTVHFTCTDGASGIVSCPADQLFTTAGTFTSTAQTTTDNAGNVSAASNTVTVRIDKTIPTISAAISAGTLGLNGWYRTNVTVHFTCADTGGSGIATCPADQILSTEGASVSSTAQTAVDNAGNVSLPSNVITVKIDKTAPTIVAAATTSPTAAGWYNANVTVHFTCTDGASGIVSCPADQLFTASGSSTAQTTADNAGNVSAASNIVTVQIDKVAPSASASAIPAPNANGWNNTNVTVSFSGTDVGSGISSCTAPVTLNSEGAGQSASGTCIDNAGNISNTASINNINIDKTNPVITVPADITNEATGPSGAIVNYTATVSDNLDGGITVSCVPASGSTFAITTTAVTCTSTDQADNTTTNTFNVTIQHTTKPVVIVPADITKEATSSSGAAAAFSASASDIVDGSLLATCDHSSGDTFPLGATTVTCSATNSYGNTGSSSFSVTVQDTTPPAIDSHAAVSMVASGPSGINVSYTNPSTSDIVDGSGTANCSPASGSLFPIGNTVVTCTAMDSHENAAEPITFVVHVTSAHTGETNDPNTVLGYAQLLIPVTGDQATELSCTESSTILEMAGFQITFANLCGYSVLLTEAPAGSLPNGNIFVSGVDIVLLHNGVPVNTLPTDASITLSYDIPSGMTGENLAILAWDPNANSGAGAWVEENATVDNGKLILTTSMPGTFVLVDKSTPSAMEEPSYIAATLNNLYVAATDFFKQFALQ